MRIFSFWVQVERTVSIDGEPHLIRCYGGSNVSPEDAVRDGSVRLEPVLQRVAGQKLPDAGYEADIREEILVRINAQNVVTRNRYGAEILNSSDLMFVDIDEPKYRFWEAIFGIRNLTKKKERIVESVVQVAAQPRFAGLGIRLYETHNGVRALVTGQTFAPRSDEARALMRSLHADRLYTILCQKQSCYRARLTPKPYRMKCQTIRLEYPRTNAEGESRLAEWLQEYERVRTKFCTCRFIRTIGREIHHPVIDFHDQATGALSGLRLA